MRGKCYYNLEKFENYIKDTHYITNELPEFEFETFMRTSLICILNNYDIYKEKDYFDSLITKIVQWLDKYESKNKIIRMLLPENTNINELNRHIKL